MASSATPAARSQAASPAPSHSTSATFGNAGGSNVPPSQAGPGLRPPSNAGFGIQRTPSQNTSYSNRSRNSAVAPRTNGGSVASEPPYVIDGPSGRIACVADVRGNISMFNQIADETNASAIIHTGDFGFYERSSFERISDRTLRHLVQYSTLVSPMLRNKLLGSDPPRGPASAEKANASTNLRQQVLNHSEPLLSEFPHLLNGTVKLKVPVFTVWGACEDVAILERFRTGEYQVPNLYVLDEATTKAIEVGGVRLRLFGLGGAVVLHKLFDNGEGAATIAGGQGTMWTTALQIGELVDTAQKNFDPTETRVLITHASPGREGLLAQLALALKADLTISAGLHFRYGVSYNEFSVQHDAENYRNKLQHAKQSFTEIWDTVKTQVDAVIDSNQRVLLDNALAVANRVPPTATATGAASEEPAWKNTWNWNLPDAAYGNLVLSIRDGRVSAETKSQGFNFAYRRNNQPMSAAMPTAAANAATASGGKGAANAASPKAPGQAQGAAAHPSTPAAAKNGSGVNTPSNASAKGGNAKDGKKTPREKGHESAASRSDAEGYLTSGTEGGGASSGRKNGPRNPNTIYISQLKDVLPVTEADIREYFGPAAAGITSIKLIFDKERFSHRRGTSSGKEEAAAQAAAAADGARRQRPFAYVEFKDEAAMKEAFKRQGQTIKGTDVKPALEQADSAKVGGAGAASGPSTPSLGTAGGKAERGEKPDRKERKQSRSNSAAAAAAGGEGKQDTSTTAKEEGAAAAAAEAGKSDAETNGGAGGKADGGQQQSGKPKKTRGGKGHNKKNSAKEGGEANGGGGNKASGGDAAPATTGEAKEAGAAKSKPATATANAAAPEAAAAATAPAVKTE